jgi:hypothetical protein
MARHEEEWFPHFSKERSAFLFRVSLLGLLDREDKCITILRNTESYLPNDTA